MTSSLMPAVEPTKKNSVILTTEQRAEIDRRSQDAAAALTAMSTHKPTAPLTGNGGEVGEPCGKPESSTDHESLQEGSIPISIDEVLDDHADIEPEFDLDWLGNSHLKTFAQEIARAIQMPEDAATLGCLCTLGAAFGKGAIIEGGVRGRTTYCNLFGLFVARSGIGKSVLMEILKKPMAKYQIEAVTKWGNAFKAAMKNSEDKDKDKDKEKDSKNSIGAEPCFFIGAATSEALLEEARRQGGVLATISPEAGDALRTAFGAFKKTGTDLDHLLSGFSGEQAGRRSKTTGKSSVVEELVLSLSWAVQPTLYHEILANRESVERGFLARCLVCQIKSEIPEDDGRDHAMAASIRELWEAMVFVACRTRENPISLKVTDESELIFREFHNQKVREANRSDNDVSNTLLRLRENAIRISGIIALVNGEHSVNADTARRACQLADHYSRGTINDLRSKRQELREDKAVKLHALLIEKYTGKATLRNLNKNNGQCPDEVKKLAHEFKTMFKLTENKQEKGGRSSWIITAI